LIASTLPDLTLKVHPDYAAGVRNALNANGARITAE
jgi:hypothetical protein